MRMLTSNDKLLIATQDLRFSFRAMAKVALGDDDVHLHETSRERCCHTAHLRGVIVSV